MKKSLFTALTLLLCTAISAENSRVERTPPPRPEGYDSRDASILSMMGWGIGICVGIAALCALIDNNPGSTTD